jgi:hypothetical protein
MHRADKYVQSRLGWREEPITLKGGDETVNVPFSLDDFHLPVLDDMSQFIVRIGKTDHDRPLNSSPVDIAVTQIEFIHESVEPATAQPVNSEKSQKFGQRLQNAALGLAFIALLVTLGQHLSGSGWNTLSTLLAFATMSSVYAWIAGHLLRRQGDLIRDEQTRAAGQVNPPDLSGLKNRLEARYQIRIVNENPQNATQRGDIAFVLENEIDQNIVHVDLAAFSYLPSYMQTSILGRHEQAHLARHRDPYAYAKQAATLPIDRLRNYDNGDGWLSAYRRQMNAILGTSQPSTSKGVVLSGGLAGTLVFLGIQAARTMTSALSAAADISAKAPAYPFRKTRWIHGSSRFGKGMRGSA